MTSLVSCINKKITQIKRVTVTKVLKTADFPPATGLTTLTSGFTFYFSYPISDSYWPSVPNVELYSYFGLFECYPKCSWNLVYVSLTNDILELIRLRPISLGFISWYPKFSISVFFVPCSCPFFYWVCRDLLSKPDSRRWELSYLALLTAYPSCF